MAKKKKGAEDGAVDRDEAQPALMPMSDDEIKAAGRTLAAKIRDLEDLEEEHESQRADMADARKALREEISSIASTLRTQGR